MGQQRSSKRGKSPRADLRPSEIVPGRTRADDARVLTRINADVRILRTIPERLGELERFARGARPILNLYSHISADSIIGYDAVSKRMSAVERRVSRIENSRRIDTLAIALAASSLIVACAGWFM